MLDNWTETRKKARYVRSFLAKRLVHVNLQLLYDCNFRCEICDFWKDGYGTRPRLSAAQVQVIADKLAMIGPQVISIGGGEPLMHDELETIVGILARDHFPVMICNGWYVTAERARALFGAGIHEISISVDFADAARHDAQRGRPGAYERALRALRVLNDNRVHSWQRVHMISVVMEDNLDEMEKLVEMCAELGVTYLVTLYSHHRGLPEKQPQSDEVSERLLDLKRRYPRFVQLRGYLARFSEATRDSGIGGCYAGKNLCNVDSQGNVTLCIDRLDKPVGNLLHDSMADIEAALLQRYQENDCAGCWTSCRGAIETLMYGGGRVGNLLDYWGMTRSVPLS